MNKPILERIAANIVQTLSGVSTSNGYQLDFQAAERRRDNNEFADLKPIVAISSASAETQTNSHETWIQQFEVLVTVVDPEAATEADLTADERMVMVWADVKKALAVDKTRGGLAHWTEVTGYEIVAPHIIIEVAVQYETLIDDATAQ